MSIAAAIRITSPNEERVIERAAEFAQQQNTTLYVISVVRELPHGAQTDEEREIVQHNLDLIAKQGASPVFQEGDDIPHALLVVARAFGVHTMFVQSGHTGPLGRSVAEQLLYLNPPFEIVIVGSE